MLQSLRELPARDTVHPDRSCLPLNVTRKFPRKSVEPWTESTTLPLLSLHATVTLAPVVTNIQIRWQVAKEKHPESTNVFNAQRNLQEAVCPQARIRIGQRKMETNIIPSMGSLKGNTLSCKH